MTDDTLIVDIDKKNYGFSKYNLLIYSLYLKIQKSIGTVLIMVYQKSI